MVDTQIKLSKATEETLPSPSAMEESHKMSWLSFLLSNFASGDKLRQEEQVRQTGVIPTIVRQPTQATSTMSSAMSHFYIPSE